MTKLKFAKIKKIYAPQNAEFCQLAFNGWRGCAHRCRYCYGPRQTHKTAEEFRTPQPKVGNIFQDLDSDLQLLAGNEPLLTKEGKTWIEVPRPVPHVLLMSDCDPYSPPGGDLTLPRKVLAKFNYYGIPFKVLTKAGTKAIMDFDLYDREKDFFGVSLTFLNEADACYWEPGAASPADRIAALEEAHKQGLKTWCSMEAVIDQAQALNLIDIIDEFADFIWIGKVNKCPEADEKKIMSWPEFRTKVETKLQELGREPGSGYQIKSHLREAT